MKNENEIKRAFAMEVIDMFLMDLKNKVTKLIG
jgi:hypothetical protein